MLGAEANSYAAGLFKLAVDLGKVESFQKDMKEALALLEANPDLLATLSSYSLPNESQLSLADKAFATLKNKEVPAFFRLLIIKHEVIHFDIIASSFNKLCNDHLGIKEGLVYSASPLTKEEIKKIEESMGKRIGSALSLTNHVDHNLIGGVKVYVDDKVFDGTVLGKVERLRSALLK